MRFYIDIEVDDSAALYAAARARCLSDRMTFEEAEDCLRPDGMLDVSACLQMILDPGISPDGTSILQSGVES